MSTRTLSLMACFALLVGCNAVDATYEERSVMTILGDSAVVKAPADHEVLPPLVDDGQLDIDTWWTRFNDDALTRLITKAFRANRTLEITRANLRAAREAWKFQRGTLLPLVNGSGAITRNRGSENGRSGGGRFTDYSIGVDATWELDFFGQQQYLIDAAAAEAEAAEANLKSAWISLSSEVAMCYIELRTLQGRLMIAEDTYAVQQSNVRLLTDRSKGGLSTELERIQAEYDLQTTAATIPSLKAQIVRVEDALAILCGITPGTLPKEIVTPEGLRMASSQIDANAVPQATSLRTTDIPRPERLPLETGIPASAIRQRPDVIAAERMLKAAVDKLGSAQAERYPRVFLSGSLGLNSLKANDLLNWNSHLYSFGPGISIPIFRGGQINANINIKEEAQKAALANYEEIVLSAVADIRTALTGYACEEERLEHLRKGASDAATAYEIAYNAYTGGRLRFFEVLDAQRRLFSLDEARVISEGAMAQAQVQLYKALCGGWSLEKDAEDAEVEAYFFGSNNEHDPLLAGIVDQVISEEASTEVAVETPAVDAPVEAPAEVAVEAPAEDVAPAVEAPAEVAVEAPAEDAPFEAPTPVEVL